MDNHTFAIGDNAYVNITHESIFGSNSYKGLVTIYNIRYTKDNIPLYDAIKTSMATYTCTLNLYNLDNYSARFLGVCGYEHTLTKDMLMEIPQKREYTKDELAVFQIAYENRNNASFVKSETDADMIDDDMAYYRKAMKFK